ncbi:uncharacterized protein HD556DRAFT_1451244 [Suillus plorans]|uniref:Uncharacterized protein n=1 Tax=Suillus plorans TaxID=116603 RepID=A0A9P7ABD1_9AGAM|nr:uncharacterized protein HD556DRAFT_1451244 [Suillus plorans]KAG1784931.1 hypothetical protein HD556DRAFT_1451244 [Suillus plorans]
MAGQSGSQDLSVVAPLALTQTQHDKLDQTLPDTNSPTPKLPRDTDEILYDSFSSPYIGLAAGGFYEYLKNNNIEFRTSSKSYYGKFCSIVQSSGTGKSRLILELRKKGVLVLYMNLRELSDRGFPNRDPVPACILTECTMDCTETEYTARCYAFFTAIFQVLWWDLGSKIPALDSRDLDVAIKAWNDEMCDMHSEARTKFFEMVDFQYNMNNAELENVVTQQVLKSPRQSSVKQAFRDMVQAMPHIFAAREKTKRNEEERKDKYLFDEPKLVIAFDKACPLNKLNSRGIRLSRILCSVISSYSHDNTPVWVVFASTTSQAADFPPPQVIQNSMRVVQSGNSSYPPYHGLGWDQFATPLGDMPANDIAKFCHVVGFGRPLWKSLMLNGGVLKLAGQKLCNSMVFDSMATNQALAVLAQRFALDIRFGHRDTVSYIKTAVASHLRVCFSTTENGLWSDTGYPSEPLLSCVAAMLLHQSPDNLPNALHVLENRIHSGMVEIGQSGGLTSRLLLLLAKDLFVRRNPPEITIQHLLYNGSEHAELLDCQKVSVVGFLEYLFGAAFWSDSEAGEEAKTAFQHAYINFSHWISMEEFISPADSDFEELASARCDPDEWTLRHWHRTSAVQCCPLQPLVDKMIPIYFDDPSLGPDLKRMSQIFISDKVGRISDIGDPGYDSTRTHYSIECQSDLPYITLLLDLNVDSDPQLSATYLKRDPSHPEAGQCLRIYASGMSDTTFPFLNRHPPVAKGLQEILSRQKEAPSQTIHQALRSTMRDMRWEA